MEKMTEYKREFVPHPLTPAVTPNYVRLGPKTDTGFTKATEPQVNIFEEQHSSRGEPHQAHSSVMKSDFPPPSLPPGSVLPFCSQSCRETGYTRGSMDPLSFLAEAERRYQQRSFLPSSENKNTELDINITVKKEPSGYLRNLPSNQTVPTTTFVPSNFTTIYKSMFCHPADSKRLENDATYADFISSKKGNTYTSQNMDRFIFRG